MSGGLNDLVKFVGEIGKDPRIVQGAGGNFSIKSGSFMHIKPSGFCFDKMKADDLVKIDLASFKRAFIAETRKKTSCTYHENAFSELLSKFAYKGKRASMETPMHCFLPKFVLHVHPLIINVFLCMKGGDGILKNIFKDIKISIVPYLSPGFELGREIMKQNKADVFFLENHGVIICAGTMEKLRKLFGIVNKHCSQYLYEKIGDIGAFNVESAGINKSGKYLFPDAVVYQNSLMNEAQKYILTTIEKLGGSSRFLSRNAVKYLVQMESEKYRRGKAL